MAQQSIYASREGALYQSYDNYAGASGFYDPAQDMPPQQPIGNSATPMSAIPMQPAQYQQATFAQFHQEQAPAYQPVQYQQYSAPQYTSYSAMPMQQAPVQYYQPMAPASGTVQVTNAPQFVQQPAPAPAAPSAPVAYGAQLRGVGIKFGERIDPRSGGMLVYVKRLVKGGPADQCNRIQPGDVLQLINGDDIYGQGLDILRDKIPGPAGTTVKLGFRSYAGQLYEVDLARTAYGDQPPEQTPAAPQSAGGQYMYAQQPVQQRPMMMTVAQPHQHQQYIAQGPQQTQYVMAPRQQQVQYAQQQPAVQYVQQVQYVTAPQQQMQYQPVQYQQQPQYQPLPSHQQYQQQPSEQFLQPFPQAPQQQYAPAPPQQQQQYAPPQQQQQQPQYAPAQQQLAPLQYAPQQQQQQYAPPPPQQQQQQQQQQQPVYGDYQGGYGDYGPLDDPLQGTQV